MSTAMQLRGTSAISLSDWNVIREQASMLVKTGFLPQAIKTPEQALAIILTGRELGIGPMAALGTINVIQGKPTISPQLMLALIQRSGELEDLSIVTGEDGAKCTMKRRGQQPYTEVFGPEEAALMGLNTKDNYRKQAPTMYKWRAVGGAARTVFSDVILGLYTPEEMGASVDAETGEILEPPPAPPIRLATPKTTPTPQQLAIEAQAPIKSSYPVMPANGEGAADESAEVIDVVEGEPLAAGEVPLIGKADLLKIVKLTERLQEYGVEEDIWRDRIEAITGQRSRHLIEQGEAERVIADLAAALNQLVKERPASGRGGKK